MLVERFSCSAGRGHKVPLASCIHNHLHSLAPPLGPAPWPYPLALPRGPIPWSYPLALSFALAPHAPPSPAPPPPRRPLPSQQCSSSAGERGIIWPPRRATRKPSLASIEWLPGCERGEENQIREADERRTAESEEEFPGKGRL